MVRWKDFKNGLPSGITSDKKAVKMLFIHWTLKLNGLVCCGAGDVNDKMDITDVEVAQALAHVPSKHIMYRDPANQNELLNLGCYQKDGGTQILVVLESDTNKESVCSLFNLHCHGKREKRADKLLNALQTYIQETKAGVLDERAPTPVRMSKRFSSFDMIAPLRATCTTMLNQRQTDMQDTGFSSGVTGDSAGAGSSGTGTTTEGAGKRYKDCDGYESASEFTTETSSNALGAQKWRCLKRH